MRSTLFTIFPIIFGISLTSSLQITIGWIAVVLGIGFLIFVHELGHFVVAKLEKVKVEAFALGFGFPLFSKKYGETEYKINILPLGGYVKMAGEMPGEEMTGGPDEFMSKRPGQRARIIVAGVLMNFIFGLLAVIIVFQTGIRFPAAKVGRVVDGSPAWHVGIQQGDTIVEIDGEKVTKFKDVILAVAFNKKKVMNIKVERQGQSYPISFDIEPAYDEERGMPMIGLSPALGRLQISEGSSFYAAGLRTGDKILKVNEHPIEEGYQLYSVLSKIQTPLVVIQVEREESDGKKIYSYNITPQKRTIYRLGIVARQLIVKATRKGSSAEKQGLLAGDDILSVNRNPIHSLVDLYDMSKKSPTITLVVARKEEKSQEPVQKEFTIETASSDKLWDDVCFTNGMEIGEVVEKLPAARYLKPGDKLLEIEDKKLKEWNDISEHVYSSEGKSLRIKLLRGKEEVTVSVAPAPMEELNFESLGLLLEMTDVQKYGFVDACRYAVRDAWQMVKEIFLMLEGLLVTRQISAKNLGGPVIIFTASYSQFQLGFGYFIYFLAIISINLAVINLLPIPVLDGGLLALLLVEKIRGKRVPDKFVIWLNYIGLAFLIFLILYVTHNDILRLFGM